MAAQDYGPLNSISILFHYHLSLTYQSRNGSNKKGHQCNAKAKNCCLMSKQESKIAASIGTARSWIYSVPWNKRT